MSILIKGMDMPQNCKSCSFAGLGGRRCELNVCMFTGKSQPKLSPERMNNCPLVLIPPHGRLIDADALLSQYKGNIWTAQTDYAEGLRDVAKDIADAPTVIPAEEGK